MATVLLVFIYLIYIGLGIPDSILGAAWPAMFTDLHIPIGMQSLVAVLISLSTVIASMFSARIINKLGTGVVTALSTILTAASLLGFSFSRSIVWICLLSLPLGFGAGAIDAALNNYVALHYKSHHMNFLHSFYGLGVVLSPFIVSLTINLANGWQLGYRTVSYIQFGLGLFALLCLPLWKKVKLKTEKSELFKPKTLKAKEMFSMPAVRVACLTFFFATALEFTCDNWACTFLVDNEGIAKDTAAMFVTLYYVGIMVSRFITGFITKKVRSSTILLVGHILVAGAIIVLCLPVSGTVKGFMLLVIGLGNGPTFPNLIYHTPEIFGKEVSQSIVGAIMAFCNLGILIAPQVFGIIAGAVSVKIFPYFILLLLAFTVAFTFLYELRVKKMGKNL